MRLERLGSSGSSSELSTALDFPLRLAGTFCFRWGSSSDSVRSLPGVPPSACESSTVLAGARDTVLAGGDAGCEDSGMLHMEVDANGVRRGGASEPSRVADERTGVLTSRGIGRGRGTGRGVDEM